MTKKLQTRYPNFYNVIDETGAEKSVELIVGGAWKVLRNGEFVPMI